MNIKILDSWIRDYLKTDAPADIIAEKLSLTSVSVDRVDNYGKADFIYDIEVTTNRPDLFCVLGLAREAAAILPQFGIKAEFKPLELKAINTSIKKEAIEIINNPKLVNRVMAVAMDVEIKSSSKLITERLETSGIRSLNNVIDITNYVMRITGHPTHVFDLDRLDTKTLKIREAKKGEQIETLDNKIYSLKGGEIIAENDKNEIVDLLGVMGLSNSVVTNETKRILFFIDNNDSLRMRKASMELGIRTEAAILNEKNLDPEIAMDALNLAVSLLKEHAKAINISKISDIYPNKPKTKIINASLEKINNLIGVNIDVKKSQVALDTLGFKTKLIKNLLEVEVPTFRLNDVEIEEDIIEEIARIYGYHNLPSFLPPLGNSIKEAAFADSFYWEKRTKTAMKYLGFTEVYTYSFVSEKMFDGPTSNAVELSNPLTNDFLYMRNTLVPSLLEVIINNKNFEEIKIFEISNIYLKKENNLPTEKLSFAGAVRAEKINFFEIKGLLEQILTDLGITNYNFKKSERGGIGASIYIEKEYLGEIEQFDSNLIDFELDFELILKHANNKKILKAFAKYPPVVEDLTVVTDENIDTEKLISCIKTQSNLINEVSLKDTFDKAKTFHIVYQDFEKNLTKEDVGKLREKIIASLKEKYQAVIK